ncbi:MAG: hypothetical protein KFF73_00045 [Cyclobacteriaceae bacterium]|nr:hypothetical protein [Cyclobacteriaceae bacterium]
MKRRKRIIWISTAIAAILLSVITFTPLVIPLNNFKPELLGMPYTLWAGILVMIAYILNTLIAIFVHPGNDNDR